jgi:hypothetical protein
MARPVDWPAAVTMVAALLLMSLSRIARMVYRLHAERARCETLVQILGTAPAGTEIHQRAGPGGPALQIWVGKGTEPDPQRESADRLTVVPASRGREERGGDGARSPGPSRVRRRVD